MKSNDKLKYSPLFILGANRSGTSVLTKLLEQHPLIAKTHEDKSSNLPNKKVRGHYVGYSESHQLLEQLTINAFASGCGGKWANPTFISNIYVNGYSN